MITKYGFVKYEIIASNGSIGLMGRGGGTNTTRERKQLLAPRI